MKNVQSEKLSDHLADVDEEILTRALEIDDADKLKRYVRAKKSVGMRGFVRRASAVAACLLLAVGLWLTVPAFFFRANSKGPGNKKPQDTNSQNRPPWLTTEEGTLTIESIDMLNYYAAIKMLSDTESANRTARYTNGNGITLYAASTGSAEKPPIRKPSASAPRNTARLQ